MGLPWNGANITPLPEPHKPAYLQELIQDCLGKGAQIVNQHGGELHNKAFMFPAVLYPCNLKMRVAKEEQFGPVVPVFTFKETRELEEFLRNETEYGQQAALFTQDSSEIPHILDYLAHHVTRVNINAQCQRGPDVMPFSGRKASASGTLSVRDALRTMSIRVAVAIKSTDPASLGLFQDVLREGKSNVLRAELLI
jgi:acyl-CoA reductase-like NAD-dependent aldehyde dehydrogenase